MPPDEQQAATDQADQQAAPAAEAEGAREPTLDELLAEYDGGEKSDGIKPTSDTKDDGGDDKVAALEKRLEAFERQSEQDQYQNDVINAVKAIRGESNPEIFTDVHMEGWLTAEAKRDPRIARAWMDRADKPQTWGKIQDQLKGRFNEWIGSMSDSAATEDRAAIADAVRGASKKAPAGDDVDREAVMKMGDGDFESYVATLDR